MGLHARFLRQMAGLDRPIPSGTRPPITEADLEPLPEPVRRYLAFMGVLGRPRDVSMRLSFRGRFKVKRDAPWRPCEVWQYDTSPKVTRSFLMQMRFFGLPVVGRDIYEDGHGRMIGKLLDVFTVIDGSGREFDIGELVTYLNDIVMMAPSMLLVPAVTFSAVDERSFDLALADHGHTVRARVFLDERGAPVDFETTDRFCEDPSDPKRLIQARWRTPMDGFQEIDGRKLPTRGRAVWHLPEGELPYAEFELVASSVAFNVRPGE